MSTVLRQFADDAVKLDEARTHKLGIAESRPSRRLPAKPLLHADRITTREGLQALREDWQALEDACDDSAAVFQSYDWCSTWADAFLDSSSGVELAIFTLRHNGKLVCLFPGMICSESGPRILRTLSEPYAQYSGMLCDPALDAAHAVETLFTAITSLARIDLIHLRHVRDGSFAHRFAAAVLRPSSYCETAPCMDLTAFTSDAAYLARYTKVQRRRRKKISTALESLGPVEFGKFTGGAAFDELLDGIVGHKQAWIAERGLHSTALHDPRLTRFIAALARREGAGLHPVITSMTAGNRAISLELGLRYRGRHCAFITGHDPELTDLSPARLHMDRAQRMALADGMALFDLMVPGDPYKNSWSSQVVGVADHARPLTARGILHCAAYVQVLRPLARAAYLRMPAALRQLAMPLVRACYRK